jgi:S1-C subfamily serine protease
MAIASCFAAAGPLGRPARAGEAQVLQSTFGAAIQKALPSVVGIRVLTAEPIEETNPFYNHPAALKDGAEPTKPKTRTTGEIGSGVIIAATADAGLVLTNFHVIQDAFRIGIRLADGRAYDASLIGRDAATDVAVLSVKAPNLQAIQFGGARPVQVGDIVIAIGTPLGLDATATMGMVSSIYRSAVNWRKFEGYIQHDASVNPGNSGGALVNVDGQLIGINTAIKSPSGGSVGLAFAQPVGLAMKIADQIIRGGQVHRGSIGVASTDLTPRIASEQGLNVIQGAVLTEVEANSSAATAGLKTGDVVVEAGVYRNQMFLGGSDSIAMVPIVSRRSLDTVVGIHAVGDKMKLKFLRNNKIEVAEVQSQTITEKEARYEPPADVVRLRGLVVTEVGPDDKRFGEISGLLVAEAKPNTISQFIGLLPGDIITHVRGRPIATPHDLFETVAGDEVPEVRLLRGEVPVRFKLPF